MKPRRIPQSNAVYRLEGGNEDNDLWVERTVQEDTGAPCIRSVWEPTKEERQNIAEGHNVYLVVWGTEHPPVAMGVTDDKLGKGE